MYTDLLSIVLGFLEGLALILSPCILPILPVLLGVSLTGSVYRPVGICLGFIFCFSFVAFFSRQLVLFAHVDLNGIHLLTYGCLAALAVVMISPALSHLWARGISHLQPSPIKNQRFGQVLFSGFLLGGMLALVWVPCAGPILAVVIVQTVMQKANAMSFLVLVAFATGIALPMMVIAYYGRSLMQRLDLLKRQLPRIRQGLGILIIISVFWMLWRDYAPDQTNLAISTQTATRLQNGLVSPYPAPGLTDISSWINSPALQLNDLHGRVVLIDFWTYSCINCVRTLPHLNALYAQYHQEGLDIIGIHAPEFVFERDEARVRHAVQQHRIQYPVALDNHFSVWLAFDNHYWPAQFLIDPTGNVVYEHFGEGDEAILENNIRYLLNKTAKPFILQPSVPYSEQDRISPETYLGYERSDRNNRPAHYISDQDAPYHFPAQLSLNAWALDGVWRVLADRIMGMQSTNRLRLHFRAKNVYLVMGSERGTPIKLSVQFNGDAKPAIQVSDHTLYPVLTFEHVVEGDMVIESAEPGLAIYTVTFGR